MKPLNAFLGEQFLGKWVDGAGTTELVSEQVRWVAFGISVEIQTDDVSHHPPATAFNVWNEEHGIRVSNYDHLY